MKVYNFEAPALQSGKGIVIIFLENAYKFIKVWFPVFLVGSIGLFSKDNYLISYKDYIVIGLIFIVVAISLGAILKYFTFKFHVYNGYFILHKGVFQKEEITIPKTKIQNIHIKQNFMQQILDVVALNIETAGDDKTEIEIKALSKPLAMALKEALLINYKGDVLEIDKNEEVDTVYFKITPKQLFLEGISENHFRSFLIVLALLSGVYDTVKDVLALSQIASYNVDSSYLLNTILFNSFLIGLLLLLAFLYSILRIFTFNFNLKVSNTNSGLEISKGLFNKVSLHIQKNKIQNIRLQTNRFKKYLGLYSLRFSQIMESKKQREYLVIIALNAMQATQLVDKFYKGFSENFQPKKPEFYFKRVLALQFTIPIIIINGLLLLGSPYLLLLNMPLISLIIWNINQTYKKSYYSIDKHYFIKGSGNLIDTNTDYLELKSIQSVENKQTIFQKRRQLTSVVVYSATNKLTIPHIKVEIANQIVNYLLFKIETQDKNWM